MTGTQPQRVARLVADLFMHPNYLVPYLQTNITTATPLALELPWISYAAIDFLNDFAKPNMAVFEYGSGGSTLFFARRCASVVSTEDSASWLDTVQRRLADGEVDNVVLQHRRFDFKLGTAFEASAYLNSIPDRKLDIILVDSTEEAFQVRPRCFYHAENFVREGGIIVVDDSWRYLELRRKNRAKKCRVFQSVGPCRPGVTSTDIFFY